MRNCVLVTGGLGFIGINYLLLMSKVYKDDLFVCLDKMTYAANNPQILKWCENVKVIIGDICDTKLVDELFSRYHFDYVVNFAAESHVDNSLISPLIFVKTNVEGTAVLLNAAVKYKVKKFHQVSTDEVYGEETDDYLFKESDKLNPSSPYSSSKAAADLLVLSYNRSFKLNVSISRSSNNYGLYQNKEKFIPNMIYNLLNKKKIHIYGDGNYKRDYLDVIDNVRAIDLILRDNSEIKIFNVSSHQEILNIDLARKILKIFNYDDSMIEYVTDRKGHDKCYGIDTALFDNRYHLPFHQMRLDELVKSYINFYARGDYYGK